MARTSGRSLTDRSRPLQRAHRDSLRRYPTPVRPGRRRRRAAVAEAFDIENTESADLPVAHSQVTRWSGGCGHGHERRLRDVGGASSTGSTTAHSSLSTLNAAIEGGRRRCIATLVTENFHATVPSILGSLPVFDDVEERSARPKRMNRSGLLTVFRTTTDDGDLHWRQQRHLQQDVNPNLSDISVQSIEAVYLPTFGTRPTSKYTYPYEYYAAGPSRK